MIRRENPNFVASIYAPNPKEVTYWIDLTEGPDGQIIKSYVNNKWVKVNEDENTEQSAEIQSLKNRCTNLENNKLDKSTYNEFVQEVNEVHTELDNSKADNATTLAGYGITDAYTKTEVDDKLNAKVAANVAESSSATVETLETKVNELINALIAAGLMATA